MDFKEETTHLHHITRSSKTILFYKKLNIFSFLSAYVFYEWFKKHGMLEQLELIPVVHPKDIYIHSSVFKNNHVIFIDIDITKKTIKHFIVHSKTMEFFDNKRSTEIIKEYLVNSILPKELLAKANFYNHSKTSVLYVVYRAITKDDYPKVFTDLEEFSYDKFTNKVTDYNLRLPAIIGNNFDIVDNFVRNDAHLAYKATLNSRIVVGYLTDQALTTVYNNSYACDYNNYKAAVINNTISNSMFIIAVMLSVEHIDFAICYEKIGNIFNYKIVTRNKNIDLIKLFKKYEPIGYTDCVWFSTNNQILSKYKISV